MPVEHAMELDRQQAEYIEGYDPSYEFYLDHEFWPESDEELAPYL